VKIESLTFQITPSQSVADFINKHKEVWEPWLRQQQGFIRKQIDSVRGNQVTILLFWDSLANMERAYGKVQEIAALGDATRKFPGSFSLIHYYTI
jgi:hypothetical protein